MSVIDLINLDNDVFRLYAFYASVVTLKLLFMSPLVGLRRVFNKSFANPEDAGQFKAKVNKSDEAVERIRRAHLNDLENIPPFWVLGILYVLTNPSYSCASICFRSFAFARIGHSISYLNQMFFPRFACFAVAMTVNLYMGFKVLLAFW